MVSISEEEEEEQAGGYLQPNSRLILRCSDCVLIGRFHVSLKPDIWAKDAVKHRLIILQFPEKAHCWSAHFAL